jgi:NTP pyrophosphatase (non-canonical NTP hydrolase)
MPNEISLNGLFAAISEWQKGVFPDASLLSAMAHLLDETKEVEAAAMELFMVEQIEGTYSKEHAVAQEALAMELADIIHLCIACASAANIHLPTAIEKKFQKNQTRNFTYDPDRGYSKGD